MVAATEGERSTSPEPPPAAPSSASAARLWPDAFAFIQRRAAAQKRGHRSRVAHARSPCAARIRTYSCRLAASVRAL
eukprot:7946738-Alexandrium_andersonii.AAC.1